MEQLRSQESDVYEKWFLRIFRQSVVNIQVSLKSDKNNGYCTRGPLYIFGQISLNSSWNEERFTHVVQDINTSIVSSINSVHKSCRLWDKVNP